MPKGFKLSLCFWGLLCFSAALAAADTFVFECGEPGGPGSVPPAPSTGVAKGVAIYATHTGNPDTLPTWWTTIWYSTVQLSVPKFYKDNSMNRYNLQITPYGRDASHCFVSDSVPSTPAGGEAFTRDILRKADDIIDFRSFDANGDNVVDAVFLVIVNMDTLYYKNRGSTLAITEFETRDSTPAGPVKIIGGGGLRGGQGVGLFPTSREAALAISCHEWGHALGALDWYGIGTQTESCWGLGSFSTMGWTPWNGRVVPFDPWHRIHFNWVTPIEVAAPIFELQIPDYLTTGTVYRLMPDTALEGQHFLVTNHKGVDPAVDQRGEWERFFPNNGLLIWHIRSYPSGCKTGLFQDSVNIDIELAHGMWRYVFSGAGNPDPCSLTVADSSTWSGRDSLDLRCVAYCACPPNSRCTTSCGYPAVAAVGSPSCLWPYGTKKNFDGKSNPSSDLWTVTGASQTVPSHTAARNIAAVLFQPANADLLVNNWFGHITQNTAWGPNKTYAITGDVTVDPGVTLTIQPGTVIKFQKDEDNQHSGGDTAKSRIIVNGMLNCLGTRTDSIILTSSAASPAAGDWGGIFIGPTGRADVAFTRFSFAETALVMRSDTGTVKVRNSTFTHFKTRGVYSTSTKADLGKSSPTTDCGRNNILLNTADTGAVGVQKAGTGMMSAVGNWWTSDPPPSNSVLGSVTTLAYFSYPANPDSACPGGGGGGGGCDGPGNGPCAKITVVDDSRPSKFELAQNYPNPFNAATVIRFALPQPSRVELRIYNILGQVVRSFVEEKPSGLYEVFWDGRDENGAAVSSGIYLYQIKAEDFVQTKKMQLVK